MTLNSVRVRLTLWNVLVLALVLGGFGVAMTFSVRAELQNTIDGELARRADRIAGWWARVDWGAFPLTDPTSGPPSMNPFPTPPEQEVRPGASRIPEAAAAERAAYFRRPRVLDLDATPLVPFSGDEPWDPAAFVVAGSGQGVYSTIRVHGESARVYSIPLRVNNKVEGVVQVAAPLAQQQRLQEGQMRTLMTLLPVALLIAGLGGLFLTDRALRPVRRVTQEAAEITAADLSRRLPVTERDEIGELATTINGMIGRLEESFHQIENAYQRLEAAYEQQRRFTADASHELRTPLTRIKGSTSLALSGERSPEDYRRALEIADQAADGMNRLVQDLLMLARSDSGQLALEKSELPLKRLLEQAISDLANPVGAGLCLNLPEEPIAVLGDEHHLRRLFVNLLDNALRHTPAEGTITLSADAEGGLVAVRVQDTGVGIAPEHLPHLCERFYRVDASRTRSRGGTGLGLAICRSIARSHGGELIIDSEVGRGTTVTVTLPRAASPVPAALAGS